MTDNSYKILTWLKTNDGATAKGVSEATDIAKRLVDSYFSAAIEAKGLGYRDRTSSPSKLHLTAEGQAYEQESAE